MSPLQEKRLAYLPRVPKLLLESCCLKKLDQRRASEDLRSLFPKTFAAPVYQLQKGEGKRAKVKVGVVFSGGPAAGGHNVIAGIFDAGAHLIGFLEGPRGIIENRSKEITNIDSYRNQGGFDLLGTGRDKIEKEEDLFSSLKTCEHHKLDGLIVIGGDDSNTNAAILAEYFLQKGCKTKVIGVPKTIDGDLRSKEIEISFGFDSACKTYSELIGNIARDALSTKKYYHFIKLMGRSASHIALECALATHPNLTLISEEKKPLSAIVEQITGLIIRRFERGKSYGIVLIPEGLAEFMPALDLALPKDPHGNIEVSKIQTEKLIIEQVKQELKKKGFQEKWNVQDHFFGYEGRSCMPSNFDANYTYALGHLACIAVREGLTGMICAIQNLKKPPEEWEMKMVPIVQLMHLETRLGKEKPVIRKAMVDTNGTTFVNFSEQRGAWEMQDQYRCPGPIQFFGGSDLVDSAPLSL